MTTHSKYWYFCLFVKSSFTIVYANLVQLLKKVSIFLGKEGLCRDRLLTCNEQLGILTTILKVDIHTVDFHSYPSYHKPVTSLLIDNYFHTLRNVKENKIFYFI